jgi:hypothetical protein
MKRAFALQARRLSQSEKICEQLKLNVANLTMPNVRSQSCVLRSVQRSGSVPSNSGCLSTRQRDVLELLAHGYRDKEIADAFRISVTRLTPMFAASSESFRCVPARTRWPSIFNPSTDHRLNVRVRRPQVWIPFLHVNGKCWNCWHTAIVARKLRRHSAWVPLQ